MANNKLHTARELQELTSAVDQYPGLGDFAATQVEPVLSYLRKAQQAAQGLLASTQKVAGLVNTAMKRATELDMYTDSQPFTMLGRMTTVGTEARPGELKELAGVLSSNATSLSSLLGEVQGAFNRLTQEYNALANQVEATEQSAAQEAPQKQPQPSGTPMSTGDPGVQYTYE